MLKANVLLSCLLAMDLIGNQSHPLYHPHTTEEIMPRQGRQSNRLQEAIPSLKCECQYRAPNALHFLCKSIQFNANFAAVNTLSTD